MIALLFVIGIIMYGLGRATQQATIFMLRSSEELNPYLDESREIHLLGWLEPLGLLLAGISLGIDIGFSENYFLTFILLLAYFIYWLPYALLYCYLRKKVWFAEKQRYRIGIFKHTIEIQLLDKTTSIIMFILAILGSFIIL